MRAPRRSRRRRQSNAVRAKNLRAPLAGHLRWLDQSTRGLPWGGEVAQMVPELLVVATADEAERGWRRLIALYRSLPTAEARRFYLRFNRPALRLQSIEASLRDGDAVERMARERSQRWSGP